MQSRQLGLDPCSSPWAIEHVPFGRRMCRARSPTLWPLVAGPHGLELVIIVVVTLLTSLIASNGSYDKDHVGTDLWCTRPLPCAPHFLLTRTFAPASASP